jgi:hypothetical protein
MAAATPPSRQRPRERLSGNWGLRSHLELGALGGAVPCARLHTRHVFWEWGLSALGEPAELIVSELVTNAVHASARDAPAGARHDPGPLGLPVVWLWLSSDGRQALIEVGDGSPRPPVPAENGLDVEGGRGLLLVDSLSAGWGYYSPADDAGDGQRKFVRKIVWALLPRP